MDPGVFRAFRELAYDKAGIALRENKEALLSARISKRMRTLGLPRERDYLDYLQRDQTGEELLCFLDAISTNFTSFFRESEHFELLASDLAQYLSGGATRLRVWCAAAATGEEPYTLAMVIARLVASARKPIDWRVLATDISLRALEFASEGRYTASRLAKVPASLLDRYFEPDGAEAGERRLRVRKTLREHVVFKRLNLATPPFPLHGPLDVVFCRNVMIYFDTPVRQRLVSEIERLLRPSALLFVAHAETLSGIETSLRAVKPSVYRKAGSE